MSKNDLIQAILDMSGSVDKPELLASFSEESLEVYVDHLAELRNTAELLSIGSGT